MARLGLLLLFILSVSAHLLGHNFIAVIVAVCWVIYLMIWLVVATIDVN